MDRSKVWSALIVLALVSGAANSGDAPAPAAATKPATIPAKEASIPFANHHGIYSWRVENDRTVLIQSESGAWYKATLMSSCFNLPFAERLGFHTNPDGSFDRFSSILVRGQNCPLISLVRTAAPGKKAPGKTVKAR